MDDQRGVWDAVYTREGDIFPTPHEDMEGLAEEMKRRGARTLLDLGCGSGRHVAHLARQGFSVAGLDGAPAGLTLAERRLRASGLAADLRLGDIYAPLPYSDAQFDAVIAVQVIHHATRDRIEALAREVVRVLRPGGLLFVTVPSLRNQGRQFEEIEPGTLVPLTGREAGLPHHYFTPEELRALFPGCVPFDLHLDHIAHYCLTATKRE